MMCGLMADAINMLDESYVSTTGRQASSVLVSSLQFGVQTNASRTQVALTSRLIKRGRDRLSPPKGKQVGFL